ncbi:MAG: DUF1579 family protein, partial [Thermomicrobiales bacterium]
MTTLTEQQPAAVERDGRTDFDFYVGTWKIHSRRLRERLKGCTEWETCGGIAEMRSILGGLGNVDEITFARASGPLHGITLRLYDPASRQWSIYWADSVSGVLQIPMIGSFENGRGEFYSQEPFEGRAIFSRFIWSEITPTSCR